MVTTIQSLIEEYARRYSAQDADGVSALCEAPFLAIREGKAIHLPDGEAVREHFATIMSTYRGMGAAAWSPVEIEPHPLGDWASFTTVRWNAADERGNITRDTRTTYHLLADPEGWRFLSYTNHF
jgi:SnoaL-like domain